MEPFTDFATRYGLAIALLLFALITGAMGKWYFGTVVDYIKAEFKAQLADKDKQIEWYKKAHDLDAESTGESLRLLREVREGQLRLEKSQTRQRSKAQGAE